MNLLNLELLTATEKVAEALMMRGLFVEVKNGVLYFSKCNAKNDIQDVQYVLNQLNIPFILHNEREMEILVNKISINEMKKILTAGGHPFALETRDADRHWRFFANRRFGYRVNAFQLEYNMARFVKAANLAGIATHAGCNGHLKKSPRFQFVGPFMAAWFTVIQKRYFQDLQLNYEWKILYDGFNIPKLRAIASKSKEWCQHKIHEDTLKMAFVLEEHAAEIREMKNKSFKRAQKEFTQVWAEQKNYTLLEDWMMNMTWGDENALNERSITEKRGHMAF